MINVTPIISSAIWNIYWGLQPISAIFCVGDKVGKKVKTKDKNKKDKRHSHILCPFSKFLQHNSGVFPQCIYWIDTSTAPRKQKAIQRQLENQFCHIEISLIFLLVLSLRRKILSWYAHLFHHSVCFLFYLRRVSPYYLILSW